MTMLTKQRVASLFCILSAMVPLLVVDLPKGTSFFPALVGVLCYALYHFGLKIKLGISKNTLILCLILFCVPLLSLIWASHFEASTSKVIQLLTLLPPQILLISFVAKISRDDISQKIHYYAYAVSAGALLIILEICTGGKLFELFRGASFDTAPQTYEYNRAAVLLVMCSFSAIAILKQKIQHKLSPFIIVIPLLIALYLSVCQSAELMFVIGFLTLFLFPYQSKWAWNGLKGIILTLMLIAPFIIPTIFQHVTNNIYDISFFKNAYAGHRLEIWDYISRYALQHPFFGYGVEATRAITDFDCKFVFNDSNLVLHPHNFVVQIWIEFGLFGILIAMGLMYKALSLIQTKFTVEQQKILLPTFLSTLLASSTAYGMWQGMWVGALFYTAAMCLLACKMTPEKVEKPIES